MTRWLLSVLCGLGVGVVVQSLLVAHVPHLTYKETVFASVWIAIGIVVIAYSGFARFVD